MNLKTMFSHINLSYFSPKQIIFNEIKKPK